MRRIFEVFVGLFLIMGAVGAGVRWSYEPPREAVGVARLVPREHGVTEVYESGRGDRRIVLLASAARSISDFNELVSCLVAAGYRTLAVEARGVGRSTPTPLGVRASLRDYADDVAAVLGDGATADVVGHAFGNRVARMAAAAHPDRVRRVVLIAAGGEVPLEGEVARGLLGSVAYFLPDRLRVPMIRRTFFAEGYVVPSDWIGGWSLRAAWDQGRATRATPFETWWAGGGSAPILILQPDADVVAPRENAERLRERFGRRIEIVAVPGAGHAALPEQPAFIAEKILEFLSGSAR